jgi:hypothetical protein
MTAADARCMKVCARCLVVNADCIVFADCALQFCSAVPLSLLHLLMHHKHIRQAQRCRNTCPGSSSSGTFTRAQVFSCSCCTLTGVKRNSTGISAAAVVHTSAQRPIGLRYAVQMMPV